MQRPESASQRQLKKNGLKFRPVSAVGLNVKYKIIN